MPLLRPPPAPLPPAGEQALPSRLAPCICCESAATGAGIAMHTGRMCIMWCGIMGAVTMGYMRVCCGMAG